MWFHSLFASLKSGLSRSRRPQPAHRSTRLFVEQLEDRALPSSYSAGNVKDLIADINAANTAGGANTISLTAPTTSPYVLTAVNNTTNGATGLPVIAANDNLTILGNGDTIERSTAAGTPDFRLLEVSGGSLTLGNLTLQGGLAQSNGIGQYNRIIYTAAFDGGGAIYSQGTLVLNGVTVQDNMAVGVTGSPQLGGNGAGGGIFSIGGSVTLEGGTIVQNNEALGGSVNSTGISAGNGIGGGLYALGGTVTVTNATLANNAAVGGEGEVVWGGISGGGSVTGYGYGGGLFARGATTVTLTNATLDGNVARYATNVWPHAGYGGGGYGGGLYLATSSATLTNCTVQGNSAMPFGYVYGSGGVAEGGGLYIAYGATLTLKSDTVESNSSRAASVYGGHGGGLYIASGATVYLDPFTIANTIDNTDSTGTNTSTANIDGTYIET